MPLKVVLFQPEIPPNTGSVIRVCANTGAELHLIEPLAFEMDDAKLKRAGLDYHEFVHVRVHASLADCLEACGGGQRYAFTTKATRQFSDVRFGPDDVAVFGPETRGLPADVLADFSEAQRLRIPMREGSRSMNLANAVAVVVFEAWRQHGYPGATT